MLSVTGTSFSHWLEKMDCTLPESLSGSCLPLALSEMILLIS